MSAFWDGIFAGYGIALPVGAVSIIIVSVALRDGFSQGFLAGAGAATADFLYAFIANLAGETISRVLHPFLPALRIASGLLLVIIAIIGFWKVRKLAPGAGLSLNLKRRNRFPIYLQLLGITMINPMTVIYFTALIVGWNSSNGMVFIDRGAFVLGAGIASLSWQTTLAGMGGFARKRVSKSFQRTAMVAGNLIVLAFGLRMVF